MYIIIIIQPGWITFIRHLLCYKIYYVIKEYW